VIASLPMYLTPETRAAHDALWALIRDGLRARGIAAPDALDHDILPMQSWSAPDLVLGQICNLPYRKYFRDSLTVIGTADYGLEGCAPGQYRSLIIVRPGHPAERLEDLDGATIAYSEADSCSGWGTLAVWCLRKGIRLRPNLKTGAHRHSIEAVARGEADMAAIDAQTFRVLSRTVSETAQVRVIRATAATPGMSFVTRGTDDPALYREAIAAAIETLDPDHRSALGLRAIVKLPVSAFDLPLPPSPEDMLAMP
jgi:ABC-type phosphate/phosphonate transport system substrate-binding protein